MKTRIPEQKITLFSRKGAIALAMPKAAYLIATAIKKDAKTR